MQNLDGGMTPTVIYGHRKCCRGMLMLLSINGMLYADRDRDRDGGL